MGNSTKVTSTYGKWWREYKIKKNLETAVKFNSIDEFKRYFLINCIRQDDAFESAFFVVNMGKYQKQYLKELDLKDYKMISSIDAVYKEQDEDGNESFPIYDLTRTFGRFMVRANNIQEGSKFSIEKEDWLEVFSSNKEARQVAPT